MFWPTQNSPTRGAGSGRGRAEAAAAASQVHPPGSSRGSGGGRGNSGTAAAEAAAEEAAHVNNTEFIEEWHEWVSQQHDEALLTVYRIVVAEMKRRGNFVQTVNLKKDL